jgi:hypothetical protein
MRFLCIAVFLIFPRFSWAELDLDEGVYTAPDLGLILRLPPGWTATDQTGFPDIRLVLKIPRSDAAISVAAGRIPPKGTIHDLIAQNRKGMEAIGLTTDTAHKGNIAGFSGWLLEGVAAAKERAVRQLYVVNGPHTIIFTLACEQDALSALAEELTYILKGAEVGPPQAPGDSLPQVTDRPIM